MLIHPLPDPIALAIGPLAIRWYGLMYLAAFVQFLILGRLRLRQPHIAAAGWRTTDIDDLLFYGVLGVVIGGRLGEVLFYHPGYYLDNPDEIIAIWKGGMSFHGGFLGVLVAMWIWARLHGRRWMAVMDFIAPLVPLGYAFGRIGNFINAELWGKPTDVPWAMIFPPFSDPAQLPRHPSQLYQFALEGVALFVILWLYSRKPRPTMAVSGMFALFYGIFRFIVEFVRVPDAQLGYIAFGWLTMGQLLCVPMIVGGIFLIWWAYNRKPTAKATV